ncbi:MAG: PaaI family thioesterase [Burkholderiales bacterium]
MQPVPAGFRPIERASPFIELIGPLYERTRDGTLTLGLRIEGKHANRRGICHGGVLATLADVALGYTMGVTTGGKSSLVTASLTIDYAGSARVGDWVEAQVEVQRVGSRLGFANCYLLADEQRIVRASAIFALGKKAG